MMLKSILRWIKLTESIFATVAYATVASLLIIDVVGREVFATAFLGMQQMAVYGAILAGFLGLTLATGDNQHLRPEFLDFVAGRYDSTAKRIGDLVSAAFFVVGAIIAMQFVLISMEANDRAPVLYFVIWPLQMIIPYAFLSAALKHFIFALQPDLKPATAEGVG